MDDPQPHIPSPLSPSTFNTDTIIPPTTFTTICDPSTSNVASVNDARVSTPRIQETPTRPRLSTPPLLPNPDNRPRSLSPRAPDEPVEDTTSTSTSTACLTGDGQVSAPHGIRPLQTPVPPHRTESPGNAPSSSEPVIQSRNDQPASTTPLPPSDSEHLPLHTNAPEPPDENSRRDVLHEPRGESEPGAGIGDGDGDPDDPSSEAGLAGPLLTYILKVRETVKNELKTGLGPACYRRQTFWIRPPDPYFMKPIISGTGTEAHAVPDNYYAQPIFLWLPDLLKEINMSDYECPNPDCRKKGFLQSKGGVDHFCVL